jgi:hypothetical protein
MALIVCRACDRHVRRDDALCPFCDAPVVAASVDARVRARGTRLALLLGGAVAVGAAACSPDATSSSFPDQTATERDASPREDASGIPLYGLSPTDAGPGDASPVDAGPGDASADVAPD